ncbi:MAG: Wzz/FepE/Etk N-terminal domain-containing protein [Gammaproteobacteria bacterium]
MGFQQLLSTILGRKWLILAVTLLSVLTAIISNRFVEDTYTAAATLVIDFESQSADESDTMLPALLQSNYLNTQVGILESRHVALKVVDSLQLAEKERWKNGFETTTGGQGAIREWVADSILRKVSVKSRSSNRLVNVEYTSPDAEYAALMANEFAEAYTITNLELTIDPARKNAAWIDEQVADLRLKLETAQTSLTEYQQEKGILAADEKLDVENQQLNDLTRKLVTAQSEAEEARSQLAQLDAFSGRNNAYETLPDVLASNYIQQLKLELNSKEAQLADVSTTHGARHPTYLRLKKEVSSIRSKIKSETSTIVSGLRSRLELAASQQIALEKAQTRQKDKLLGLKKGRGDLVPLLRDVENAQRNYDEALNRFQQFSVKSSVSQTNVTVLNPAVMPMSADGPASFQKLILATILGLFMGSVLSLLFELKNRKVRTEDDLVDASGVTVLGVLEKS